LLELYWRSSPRSGAAMGRIKTATSRARLPRARAPLRARNRRASCAIRGSLELADAAHLRVLVYVGASWCEPCQRFHKAVEAGELNGALNGLRFLEFDQDRDASALKVAGYLYQYIPVLALPDPDGRNHGRMITGSIKGPNAVQENLVPRLQALLSGKAVD